MKDELERNGRDNEEEVNVTSSVSQDDREEKITEDAYNQAFRITNGKIRVPKIKSKEDARRLFFGRSANYYMEYYKKYTETGKKISWNWAAFIFNPTWFFSRKMYLYGIITTFITTIYTIGTTMIYNNMNHPNVMNIVLPWSMLFLALYISVGMFANYLYISHMENKIIYPGEREFTEEQLAKINFMRGGVSINGIIMALLVSNIMYLIVTELAGMI